MQAVGKYVILERQDIKEKMVGSIVLPENLVNPAKIGKIISIGENMPEQFSKNKFAVYMDYAAVPLKIGSNEYDIVLYTDIFCLLKDLIPVTKIEEDQNPNAA